MIVLAFVPYTLRYNNLNTKRSRKQNLNSTMVSLISVYAHYLMLNKKNLGDKSRQLYKTKEEYKRLAPKTKPKGKANKKRNHTIPGYNKPKTT